MRPTLRSRWGLLALATALVSLTLPISAINASASEPRVVVATATPLAANDSVVNKVITTSFDVALSVRHQAALSAYITSLSNTASPNYHYFLTPAQYANRYGATTAAVDAVRSYLESNDLTVGALSKGRNILQVTGTTTNIARALDASVQTVRWSDGALVARLTTSASLPSSLAKDVVSVAGLSSVEPETTNVEEPNAAATPATCSEAGAPNGTQPNNNGYTVQQQAELYGLSTAWANGDTGVGQTIAVYELSAYDPSDVSVFFNCYGLAPNITPISVDGGPTAADTANGEEEATLDVEEASVLAPGATIEVYESTNNGNGPTDLYSQIASDNTASIVTTSWGNCEAASDGTAQAEQVIFQEMAAQGQTVFSAAGDEGSADCEGDGSNSPAALGVDDPSSQPYVTGVGGLTVNNISPVSETVWNDDCTQSDCGAGGGGISTLWSQPAWQKNASITTTAATGGMRMVPDLSVMADPNTGFIEYFTGSSDGTCRRSCTSGWSGIGGTSIGAPLMSALTADAAQACDAPGGRLGFLNPTLYAMPASDFDDVTTGSNDLFNLGAYSAGPGYDMASGLGSPNGAAFLEGLCPVAFSSTKSSFTTSSTTAVVSSIGPTLSAVLRDANGNPVANAVVGVSASATSGDVRIDGESASESGEGQATLPVTSDANGALSITVSSSLAQNVAVTLTYDGNAIYTTTLTFKAAAIVTKKPGAPTISKLTALVGGFKLTLKAPSSTGSATITYYQYSLNGGKTWITIAKDALVTTVTKLAKHKSYTVIARAVSAAGASVASGAKKVVTHS
jgi:subtilase family serine protease